MIILDTPDLAEAKSTLAEIDQDLGRYLTYERYPGLGPYSPEVVAQGIDNLRNERSEVISRIRARHHDS